MRPEILLLATLAVVPHPSRADTPAAGIAGLAAGVRPELGVSGDGRVGGGLVLELRHPLVELLGVVLRGRTALGAFERSSLFLEPAEVRWFEGGVAAGLVGRWPLGERLSLEATVVGGVRVAQYSISGDGCRVGERCSLTAAMPIAGTWSMVAPTGEGSLGMLLLIGKDWGFDLSCTLALSDGDLGRGPVPDDEALTVRGGVGLRVGLE